MSKHNVRGMSIMGFLVVLGVVGFFAFMAMRIAPVFFEYRAVVQAMKGTAADPALRGQGVIELRKGLDRRFNVGYVDNVKPTQVTINTAGSERFMHVKYEVRKDLVYNIDFVATFEHRENLPY